MSSPNLLFWPSFLPEQVAAPFFQPFRSKPVESGLTLLSLTPHLQSISRTCQVSLGSISSVSPFSSTSLSQPWHSPPRPFPWKCCSLLTILPVPFFYPESWKFTNLTTDPPTPLLWTQKKYVQWPNNSIQNSSKCLILLIYVIPEW